MRNGSEQLQTFAGRYTAVCWSMDLVTAARRFDSLQREPGERV